MVRGSDEICRFRGPIGAWIDRFSAVTWPGVEKWSGLFVFWIDKSVGPPLDCTVRFSGDLFRGDDSRKEVEVSGWEFCEAGSNSLEPVEDSREDGMDSRGNWWDLG